jgi:hypothetical protein
MEFLALLQIASTVIGTVSSYSPQILDVFRKRRLMRYEWSPEKARYEVVINEAVAKNLSVHNRIQLERLHVELTYFLEEVCNDDYQRQANALVQNIKEKSRESVIAEVESLKKGALGRAAAFDFDKARDIIDTAIFDVNNADIPDEPSINMVYDFNTKFFKTIFSYDPTASKDGLETIDFPEEVLD